MKFEATIFTDEEHRTEQFRSRTMHDLAFIEVERNGVVWNIQPHAKFGLQVTVSPHKHNPRKPELCIMRIGPNRTAVTAMRPRSKAYWRAWSRFTDLWRYMKYGLASSDGGRFSLKN
jgi:hypothetical protein